MISQEARATPPYDTPPQYGAINAFPRAIGLDGLAQPWLGQDSTALGATMVAAIWLRVGFPMLLYLAALQSISPDLYEAATVDGASRWQQFWHITMPGEGWHRIGRAATPVSSPTA